MPNRHLTLHIKVGRYRSGPCTQALHCSSLSVLQLSVEGGYTIYHLGQSTEFGADGFILPQMHKPWYDNHVESPLSRSQHSREIPSQVGMPRRRSNRHLSQYPPVGIRRCSNVLSSSKKGLSPPKSGNSSPFIHSHTHITNAINTSPALPISISLEIL